MRTPKSHGRRRRLVFGLALTASLAAVFTVLGGAGLAQDVASAVQYEYGRKVTICHKGKTLRVAIAAVWAHRRHGDQVRVCPAGLRAKHARPAGAHPAAIPARLEPARAERAERAREAAVERRRQAQEAARRERPVRVAPPERVARPAPVAPEQAELPAERPERGAGPAERGGEGRGRG